MAQISKYLISKDIYDRIFDLFLKTIVNLETKNNTSAFLDGFLTPTEKVMLSKRLAIGLLLAKEYPYREISKVLKVSLGTIGSVGRNYKYQPGYQVVIQKILGDEKLEDFWLKVGEVFASVGSAGGKGSGGWRDIRNELKNKRLRKPF